MRFICPPYRGRCNAITLDHSAFLLLRQTRNSSAGLASMRQRRAIPQPAQRAGLTLGQDRRPNGALYPMPGKVC